MRYFIKLAYNGKAYHGWQNQPNAISVQEVIEHALSKLLKEETAIVGAGRTDAGVHAIEMVAHFDTLKNINTNKLVFKLNAFLPKDIAIDSIIPVKEEAHARFDAIRRTYIYRMTSKKNAFTFENCYYIKQDLNIDKMNEASSRLLHHKNFKCFSRSKTDVKTYHCDVVKAEWTVVGDELRFTIKADRFLRNMVRAIVGTMIAVGQGKLSVADVDAIIESQNRVKAGASAPAHALYLSKIDYPKSIAL